MEWNKDKTRDGLFVKKIFLSIFLNNFHFRNILFFISRRKLSISLGNKDEKLRKNKKVLCSWLEK